MRKIVISHFSALRKLLTDFNPRHRYSTKSRATLAGALCPSSEDAKFLLDVFGIRGPLDCLVGEPSRRRHAAAVRCHLCAHDLPAGSLIPVASPLADMQLYICSPEFTFVQIAASSSCEDAIYCGMALCSDFRLEPVAQGGVVFREGGDSALTKRPRIEAFLDGIGPVRGSEKARRALRYVADDARLPRECSLGMLLSLPSRNGGFDLGRLSFNRAFATIDGIDRYGRRKSKHRIPDILLEATSRSGERRVVAVDYDPFSTHAGDPKMLLDMHRRNDLATVRGLPHFALTSADANNFEYLCSLAEQIRKVLGRPMRPALRKSVDSHEGRRILMEARYRRYVLWRHFVIPPFDDVVDGIIGGDRWREDTP